MKPANIVRIYTTVLLVLACYLIVGGCNAALFPKLKMAGIAELDGHGVVQLETSKSSRVLGILRVTLGLALACCILKPILPGRGGKGRA